MIGKLNQMLKQRLNRFSGEVETRLELKKQLDYFASDTATISDLSKCLNGGNVRSLEITDKAIVVSMKATRTRYNWKRSDPRTAIACLAVVGEYEVLETTILKFFARSSRVLIDVGANVGYYVVELSQELKTDGTIHAFEPVPNSFEQLKINVSLNDITSITRCNQLAVSDSEGIIHLYQPKTSGSSASSARNLHPGEKVEEFDVPTTTLDSYITSNRLSNFDLLKVDVEGAELLVINGALKSIERFKPVIFAELLRKWSAQFQYHPNDVLNILSGLGYRCFAVSHLLPEIFEVTDDTVETNFLFVHRDQISDLDHLREYVSSKS